MFQDAIAIMTPLSSQVQCDGWYFYTNKPSWSSADLCSVQSSGLAAQQRKHKLSGLEMGVELSRCQTTSVSKTQASPFQLLVGRHVTGIIPHTTYHGDHRDLKWSLICGHQCAMVGLCQTGERLRVWKPVANIVGNVSVFSILFLETDRAGVAYF